MERNLPINNLVTVFVWHVLPDHQIFLLLVQKHVSASPLILSSNPSFSKRPLSFKFQTKHICFSLSPRLTTQAIFAWDNNAGTCIKRIRRIYEVDWTGFIYSPVVSIVNKIYKEEKIINWATFSFWKKHSAPRKQ